MRHLNFGKRLSRSTNQRKALLNNLATSLFEKGEIKTTVTKAKFARPYVEKLITVARKNNLHSNRHLAAIVSPEAFRRLTTIFAPGFKERQGGYTRIIKLNQRVGDGTSMAKLQILETKLPKQAVNSNSTIKESKIKKSNRNPKSLSTRKTEAGKKS